MSHPTLSVWSPLSHRLQVQAAEHKAQRRRYKTELHRLRALLAQDKCTQ